MECKPFAGYTCPRCCYQYFHVVYTVYPYTNRGILVCAKCGMPLRKLYQSEIDRFNHQ
nr:MAG TPA: DNA-directed RNA polymerase II subunit [Caudoviricetes sp.]